MPPTNLFWRTYRPDEGFYTSEVRAPEPLPVRTFLPTGYEPNYAYPLIVFFHGQGSIEEQVLTLAPRLSRRNYISIALRGPQPVGACDDGRPLFGWGDNNYDAQIEDYVLNAIKLTRRNYHVHSERIFLAGICEGAQLAYRFGLQFPEHFGGIIALNGAMPRQGCPLLRFPEVRQLRVFIGHGNCNAYTPLTAARQDFSLLYTAGLDVTLQTYPANHRLHPNMLRDINRWLIAGIDQ
ncbi:MAG: alpha/beta hydrolase [Gemmataceae bacterium]